MDDRPLRMVHPRPERREAVPSPVLGVLVFIMTEMMFFGGLLSAHSIAATAVPDWPPPNQPLLPIQATAANSLVLLLSGALVYWAGKTWRDNPPRGRQLMLGALVTGVVFVVVQGVEWVALIGQGLTLTTSTHAAFFYTIVGAHALHAIGGLAALTTLFVRLRAGTLTDGGFWAGRLFWYFVVLLWPVIYWRVYLP